MKILRTKEYYDKIKEKKDKALKGCDVCPYCKLDNWVDSRTASYPALTINGFVTKEKTYYKCRRCGAMWRSKSYVIGDIYGDI